MSYITKGFLLSTLLVMGFAVDAATHEEMIRLNSVEQPGVISVCEGEVTLSGPKGSVKLSDRARGIVISRKDDLVRYHVEQTSSVDGEVYARYEFEMTTRLKKNMHSIDMDPSTIRIILPDNPVEAESFRKLLMANTSKQQSFENITITKFPYYEIKPASDDPMGMIIRCGPDNRSD